MKIILTLIINAGSTSVKYSLFKKEELLYKESVLIKSSEDFNVSFVYFIKELQKKNFIKEIKEINKYGIRIVHGGTFFLEPTLITKNVIKKLEEISDLAPLHNPQALRIINQIFDLDENAKVIGVFDTAFHKTLPPYASSYALPKDLFKKYNIRRYGFHGIACQSVLHTLEKELSYIPQKLIIAHLGGGDSVTAVKSGASIDTSMGFTPLEGLMMTTRAGDLDNSVILYLSKKLKKSNEEILNILNNESGIYGLTGQKDMKIVIEKAMKGDKYCKLAVEMFVYRIIKYIYAYSGVLGGLDAIVFSGGIGEKSYVLRGIIGEELTRLGVFISKDMNEKSQGEITKISSEVSKVDVYSISVCEDKEILRQIY